MMPADLLAGLRSMLASLTPGLAAIAGTVVLVIAVKAWCRAKSRPERHIPR